MAPITAARERESKRARERDEHGARIKISWVFLQEERFRVQPSEFFFASSLLTWEKLKSPYE